MNGARFTPGPWAVIQDEFDNDGCPETPVAALGARAFVAVAIDFGPNNPDMRAANARLIAAAPEMLNALRRCAATFRDYEAVHLAEGTAEADAKASANAEIAAQLESLIACALGEPTPVSSPLLEQHNPKGMS